MKILITGGSRGIGLAIARKFHSEGFTTLICARNENDLKAVQQELPGLITYQCDMSSKDEVIKLGERIAKAHGALDILVNNAGVFLPGKIHEESDDVFETLMNTNLNSAYYLTKRLVPGMMEKKSGTIINMCSIASITAYDSGGSYSISKFALLGFSKCLREEMKPFGIRVISILPGATWTSSWEGSGMDPDRMMPPEDIAEAVWGAWTMSKRTVVEEIVLRPQLGDL